MRRHADDDIRWTGRAGDEARSWAVTRAQPIASLIVCARMPGFTKSMPPPARLIGKRLTIGAGANALTLKATGLSARQAVSDLAGVAAPETLEDQKPDTPWRRALAALPHGRIIGDARLAGAFRIGAVVRGAVHASPREGDRANALGRWREGDRAVMPIAGDFSPGRWLWLFDEPQEWDAASQFEVRQFGGIWDLHKGLRLRERQREREAEGRAYDAAVEAQEGGRV